MNTKLRKMTYTALSMSIVFVCTVVVAVPLPVAGYINLGDAAIYLSAYTLGPALSFVAAGLGSMIGDAYLGFTVYMFATLAIKGSMGTIAGYLFMKGRYLSGVISGLGVMAFGYYLFEVFLLSSFVAPLANLPFNLIQGCIGSLVGFTLVSAFNKSNLNIKLYK